MRLRLEQARDAIGYGFQFEINRFELQLAFLEFGVVENIVDQNKQRLPRLMDGIEIVALFAG